MSLVLTNGGQLPNNITTSNTKINLKLSFTTKILNNGLIHIYHQQFHIIARIEHFSGMQIRFSIMKMYSNHIDIFDVDRLHVLYLKKVGGKYPKLCMRLKMYKLGLLSPVTVDDLNYVEITQEPTQSQITEQLMSHTDICSDIIGLIALYSTSNV